jgi:hypothetical protein
MRVREEPPLRPSLISALGWGLVVDLAIGTSWAALDSLRGISSFTHSLPSAMLVFGATCAAASAGRHCWLRWRPPPT